jgi:adenosylhomocysteine nucleosidase
VGDVVPRGARILAVCGIKREAAIWGGLAVCGGGNEALLAERLERAIAEHRPDALLSFGVAGALDPALQIGDVVTAIAVTTPSGERLPTDAAWHEEIASATGARRIDMVGSSRVAATLQDKAALLRYGAAVDMESQMAARIAAAHALPFAVLRAISDTADDILPPAAVAGMREDGEIDVMAVLARLARDPRQLSALMRVGRNAERAFRRLEDVRALLNSQS